MNLSNNYICCYEMLHIYSVLLLHLQIAKYKGFLIKIQVFQPNLQTAEYKGFLIKIQVFTGFVSQIKGFKGFQQN